MDIYSYINSRDVAEYCREIGKTWTPFEMALIINRRNCTVSERHAAWHKLIEDYPDMPTLKGKNHKIYDSFHKKLIEFMEYENRVIEIFKKQEAGAVYNYKINNSDKSNSKFYSFEEVMRNVEKSYSNKIFEISIKKEYTDIDGEIKVWLNYENNICDLFVYGDCREWFDFDNMVGFTDDWHYIDIPERFELNESGLPDVIVNCPILNNDIQKYNRPYKISCGTIHNILFLYPENVIFTEYLTKALELVEKNYDVSMLTKNNVSTAKKICKDCKKAPVKTFGSIRPYRHYFYNLYERDTKEKYIFIADRVKKLKTEDKNLFKKVNKIIDEWDPLDLWGVGCPPDEYESEAWCVFEILREQEYDKELEDYFYRFAQGNIDEPDDPAFRYKTKEIINKLTECKKNILR